MSLCFVPGCDDLVRSLDMCSKHYMRVRDGRPLHYPKDSRPKCLYPKCTSIAYRRGVCRKHRYSVSDYPSTCTRPECDGKYYALGFCEPHYKVSRRKPKKPRPPRIKQIKAPLPLPQSKLSSLVAQAETRAAYTARQKRRGIKGHG